MNNVGLALALLFLVCGAGVLLGTIVPEKRVPAVTAWIGSLAAALALWASGTVLASGNEFRHCLWTIPSIGALTILLDRVSAFFLLIAAIVVLASSIFSASYMKRYVGHYSLAAFNGWYLVLCASIVWILIENDVFGFLVAWEAMSVSSYLLVNFEHQRKGTSQAGYLMLAMGEAGFIAVELVLLFLAVRAGSWQFSGLKVAAIGLPPSIRWIAFLLSFFGFGVKAGLVPVNAWLPKAHPAAPANVSAILSGVILNLGLYGIIRVDFQLVPVDTVGAGLVILLTGTVSALVGILYATTEADLKGVLAHSSIENMGIVTLGLGVGVIFAALGLPMLSGMALIAAFYHMVNHSLYKALLFLGAGSVDEHAGTRDLDRLGGLMRVMPWTAAAFLVGALAISAVPPFNGFVSEWLTLQTLLRGVAIPSIPLRLVFALCGAALALTAALAVTCFVKAFAMAFLGLPRSESAAKATEAHGAAIVPMLLLAILCFALGVLPTYVIPALNSELQPLISPGASETLVPPFFTANAQNGQLPGPFLQDFHNIGAQSGKGWLPGRGLVVLLRGHEQNPVVFAMSTSYGLVALIILLLAAGLIVRWLTRRRTVLRRSLWAGGIPRLLPQMTYTATGFSNPVRVVFQAIFQPNVTEDTRQTVAVHFRTAIRRQREETHVVDRIFLKPVNQAMRGIAGFLAGMHHGRLNAYVTYALAFLLLMLLMFRAA
ncbi:MAG TPA: proton-conducting transporter membrane subunit [Terracidiphilus sp.]|nr:proton-conducting transporter membrane subunit [Terracidiphilus sp.]